MDQYSYETIMACIKTGAPAIAPQLIAAFNNVVKLANDQTQYLQAQQVVAEKKAAASKKKN